MTAHIFPIDAFPAVSRTLHVLEAAGHQAHLVGGSVRNILLGAAASDFDIATSATPDAVKAAFKATRATVHPTGLDHGTVTVAIDGETFEITTWRRDVATDGRRATIAFADSLEEDAQRRDFTINALYAANDGTILDPTGQGLDDLARRQLRFIGNADMRILEDHLRILRYYRFAATFATGIDPQSPDSRACARHAEAITRLPKERITAEMMKLLAAPGHVMALSAMQDAGLLALILPGIAFDGGRLGRLARLETLQRVAPSSLRRLAWLYPQDITRHLRLPKRQVAAHALILAAARSDMTAGALAYRYGAEAARDALLLRAAERGEDMIDMAALEAGLQARFPLQRSDLAHLPQGKVLGDTLRRAEEIWIESGFTATKAGLLRALCAV